MIDGRLRSGLRWAAVATSVWACIGAGVGCSSSGSPSMRAARRAPLPVAIAPAAFDLPPGAADVAALRGLPYTRPLTLQHVTRARFKKVLASLVSPEQGRVEVMKAFGFVAMDAALSEAADVRLQAEQLVALYDFHARAVFVREPSPGAPPPAKGSDEMVIAHELTHALQDDHYPLAVMEGPVDTDERLARRAAYEGDAVVTSALVIAKRLGKSPDDAYDEVSTEAAAGAVARNAFVDRRAAPLLARTSTLVRAELSFVYDAGATFMARIYETGGPALANGVLKTLPTTTEQVLHPEKYVAGEGAVEVAPPSAPPGWEVVRSGRLGELATSAFLRQTLPLEVAVPAARGWGGDSYTVVREPLSGRIATLWSTVWDDAGSASRFADALAKATACGPGDAADETPRDANGDETRACTRDLGPVFQAHRGLRVVWARGFDHGDALLGDLARLAARAASRAPPLGAVTSLAVRTAAKSTAPPVAGPDGRVAIATAGVRCRIPPGFHAAATHSLDLMINTASEPGVAGSLATYEEPYDEEHVAQLRAYFASAFAAGFEGAQLVPEPPREIATPLGRGTEHRWSLAGTTVRLSVVALPRCAGAAMMFVARVTRSPWSREGLDTWLASFEDLPGVSATVCKKAHAP